jgi:ATP-dependent exoDNAse (exonuclease V) beta subunit
MGTRDGHPGLPTEEELKRSARRFRRLVEEAELRKKRPFRRIVTEEAREEWSEERARRGVSLALEDDGETPDPGSHPPAPLRAARGSRALALAVGSAVHRVLERMDPRLPLREAIQKEHEGLIAFVSRELPPEDRAPALERCRDLLTRFAEGPLGRRFTEIAPTLLARELPLLSRPGDGDLDPVGVLSGAIDLLYRDPDTGEPVVVDYKTDSVTDRGEIDDLGRRYLAQGSLYAEAVGDALGLDRTPRFELWLLVPGRILRTAAGHKGT